VSAPTPLLDFFKRGEAARDVRLLAAQAVLAPRAAEQVALLMLLVDDSDPEIRAAAEDTLSRIPRQSLAAFLARPDVSGATREFFAARGHVPDPTVGGVSADPDAPLLDASHESDAAGTGEAADANVEADAAADGSSASLDGPDRRSVVQRLASMSFSDRLKAAVKGSREMRAILVRDPNKMIAAAVMSSPKLTESEVESIARMANVSEDVLRVIGSNRSWMKNYSITVGLAKNPKTPLGMSLNLMARLNDRDLAMLAVDRNVPEPLRVAARKKMLAATSKH
jgi:hypothetical protein